MEANTNCDLVELPVKEHYMNLTLKTVAMIKYVIESEFRPKFVFLMDDDSYLNLPLLYKLTVLDKTVILSHM